MKKFLVLATSVALAASLAGCGKSAKEIYIDASKEVSQTKTMEFDATVKVNVKDPNNVLGDATTVDAINNANIKFSGIVDIDQKKYEVTPAIQAKMGGIQLDVKVPIFADEKTQKGYVKGDTLLEQGQTVALFDPTISEALNGAKDKLKGKYIEFDLNDPSVKVDEAKQKEVQDKVKAKALEFINGLPDTNFTEKDGVLNVTFPSDKTVDFVFTALDEILKSAAPAEAPTAEELKQAKDEFLKAVTLGDIKVESTVHKKDNQGEKIVVPVTFKEESMKGLALELTVDVKYKNIGKPVKFSFDVKPENVIKQAELEALFPAVDDAAAIEEALAGEATDEVVTEDVAPEATTPTTSGQ